jgi:hypothetical protein
MFDDSKGLRFETIHMWSPGDNRWRVFLAVMRFKCALVSLGPSQWDLVEDTIKLLEIVSGSLELVINGFGIV